MHRYVTAISTAALLWGGRTGGFPEHEPVGPQDQLYQHLRGH